MKVSKLPTDPGPAAWNAILPKRIAQDALKDNINCDWLIIGAGFAGLAAARRLRTLHPNDRIVILEAREVAQGPAGRNSGFMVDLPHDLSSEDYGGDINGDLVTIAQNRDAISFAADMAAEFKLGEEAFSICGKTNAAATQKGHQHNLDFQAHLQKMGEECVLYDADQMRKMTGIDYYVSGLYTPHAAMIQPAQFIRGIADGLLELGVEIYENSPVVELKNSQGWQAITPSGNVGASKVILAVNGHINSFGFLKNRLMHVFTYGSMTRAFTDEEVSRLGGQSQWGCTPSDPMGTTVRKIAGIGGHRIVIRNRFTFDPELEVNDKRIARVGRDHDHSFAARFPQLEGVEMEYRWGGRLCISRNNVNVMRELEPGLFSAVCQNGLGTVRGIFNGVTTADFASGISSKHIENLIGSDDPSKLPPRPFSTIGANLYLRYQERKAGREL